MTATPPAFREPLPNVLRLFLAHLYAGVAYCGWIGLQIIQEIMAYGLGDYIAPLLFSGLGAAWLLFLIYSIHARSPHTRKRCRIFCWTCLILSLLFLGLVTVFHGLLSDKDGRAASFFGASVATFYGCTLYWFATSFRAKQLFNGNAPNI